MEERKVDTDKLTPVVPPVEEKQAVPQEAPAAQVAQPQMPVVPTKANTIRSFINSPWVLLLVPLIGGAVWLANNTWVIMNNLDKPYMLFAGPAFVFSILAAWFIFKFFTTISSWCSSAWKLTLKGKKEDGSAQFFWMVIVVFMIVSVFASGSFFTNIEHDVIPGLGYVTALFIDLVAVQSMQARLNAARMRDKRGENLYLFGVFVCSGASAFANVYTTLAAFDQTATGVLPVWMLNVAPWFGLVFPALILLLSITADYTLDQTSSKLDPENYKAQEEKRLRLLEIQRDMLRSRATIEQEMATFRGQLKPQKAPKVRRTFFLKAWLWPANPLNKDEIVTEVVKRITDQDKQKYEQITNLINTRFNQMRQAVIQQQNTLITKTETGISAKLEREITSVKGDLKGHHKQEITSLYGDLHQEVIDIFNGSRSSLVEEVLSSLKGIGDGTSYSAPNPAAKEPKKTPAEEDLTDETIEIDESVKTVIENYPIVSSWLSRGQRSLTLEEIIEGTKQSRKMVQNRLTDGTFKKTRSPGKYRLDSVITWLKTAPLPRAKTTDTGALKAADNILDNMPDSAPDTTPLSAPIEPTMVEPITDEMETIDMSHPDDKVSANGHSKDTIKLEEFAEMGV